MDSKLTYHQLYYLKNKEKMNSDRKLNFQKNKDKARVNCNICNKSYSNKFDIQKHYLSQKHLSKLNTTNENEDVIEYVEVN
jgi:hypothetical protein